MTLTTSLAMLKWRYSKLRIIFTILLNFIEQCNNIFMKDLARWYRLKRFCGLTLDTKYSEKTHHKPSYVPTQRIEPGTALMRG